MLDRVFFSVLSMALSASFVILVVLAARLALNKAPKAIACALWGVVLFRLLCPVSFESVLSLQRVQPDAVKPQIVYQASPQIESGIEPVDRAVNAALGAGTPQASANPLQIWTFAGELIWLSGIAALLLCSLVTLARLRKRLVGAVLLEDNVWLCDGVETPFVLGFFRPKIYLPTALDAREREYILLHERMHIRRGDNLVKPVFFLTLCVYWFNPLVWLAFFLCGRDMELSCDEAVLKTLGADTRCDYSASLLRLSTGKRIAAGAPLAFGEGNVKGRIKNVLNYKKPAFWAVWLSVAAVAVLCFVLAANPKSAKPATQGVTYFQELENGNAFALRLPESCDFLASGSYTVGGGGVQTIYASGFNDGETAPEDDDALFKLYVVPIKDFYDQIKKSPTMGVAKENFRELGSCDNRVVYAVLSDGGKVSAAHKERYDKMLADLEESLCNKSFSSTDPNSTLYADRENGFYLQLPARWKGKYTAGGIADDCTAFIYTGPSKAPEEGFPETQNLLFRLYAVDARQYAAKPPQGKPTVLGTFGGKTVYIDFPNGKTEGTQRASGYREMLADAKKLSKSDVCTDGEENRSPLQAIVRFTAQTPAQEEFESYAEENRMENTSPEDFVLLHLSVTLSGRNQVDNPIVDVPNLIDFPYDKKKDASPVIDSAKTFDTYPGLKKTDVFRFCYGGKASSPEELNKSKSDTAGCEYTLCLYRRGATDEAVRRAFAGQCVTVRYRLKGSTNTNELTYPLDQILVFP